MKKLGISIIAITIGFVSMSFINKTDLPKEKEGKTIISLENETPKTDAKTIIENKCYGCHNSESKNKKGKKKLSFDTFDKLSIYKQIGKYEGIHETIAKGEMPPKKFLAKYPDKALTTKEKEVLIAWATAKGKELTK